VQLTQPEAAVAAASLARTGGIHLVGLAQLALFLGLVGLAFLVLARVRRHSTIDIARRLGG
jgi:hypothetical protein